MLMLIFVILLMATAIVSFYLGVPFAPSNRRSTQAIVEAVQLKKTDLVYELGSGDGRLAFALNKEYECNVVGFELAPLIFLWSVLAQFIKQKGGVSFLMQDFLKIDLGKATYLYAYLTPNMLEKLAIKIEKEKIHVTVITHSFAIHRWKPDQIIPKDKKKKSPVIYIYKR